MNKETLQKILRIAGYILNSLVAVTMIFAAYGGMVNPETSTIPAILAMTFPAWLILSVIFLLADLFVNRKMAIIQGVALLICLGPLLSYCPLNFFRHKVTPEEESRSFTFMSYNVYGLNDYRKPYAAADSTWLRQEVKDGISNPTLSYILSENADIVCLQEFDYYLTPPHSLISKPLYDSICRQYPYTITGTRNAILSKFPMYSVYLRQPEQPTAFIHGAIANIQGHRTLIISAHLQSIGLDSADKQLYHELTEGDAGKQAIKEAKRQLLGKLSVAFRNRANQARLIREQIDSLGVENVIVAGDFNDIPDCYAIRQLSKDDFRSAFTMAALWPTITYHANRFYFQIDHILYRGGLEAVDFRRPSFDRSDHYPIIARFLWNNSAPTYSTGHKGLKLIDEETDTTTITND